MQLQANDDDVLNLCIVMYCYIYSVGPVLGERRTWEKGGRDSEMMIISSNQQSIAGRHGPRPWGD